MSGFISKKLNEIMENKKGVVFDFDGTLVDSINIWTEVDATFFGRRGITYDNVEYFNAIAGMDLESIAHYTIERYQLNDTPEAIVAEWNAIYQELYTELKFFPGAKEFMHALHEKGIPFGIATACNPSIFEHFFLKHQDTRKCLNGFSSCAVLKKNKPDPAVYFDCCQQLGLAPEDCVVFEDTVCGLIGAKAGGFRAVCVHTDKRDPEKKAELADFHVHDYAELL